MSSSKLNEAQKLSKKIDTITQEVLQRHIQRAELVLCTWLALISSRPAFFLGAPGVDKTGTIQSMMDRIRGVNFFDALMPTIVSVEQLLVESTSIEEVSTDGGGKKIKTSDELGKAANAHAFFGDELFKAEKRVLQTTLDLAKGDGVRHEGRQVETPLLAFLAASNELPDPNGELGAVWSRMTIRHQVTELDRSGKQDLVQARLAKYRGSSSSSSKTTIELDDVRTLRAARPHVEVPDDIVETTLDLIQGLVEDENVTEDFSWVWADDRRFGRLFDIMQANALLEGRTTVRKSDLSVLKFLLWNRPEQIPTVESAVAPYARTPLDDAQELVDALLSPSGMVDSVLNGDRSSGVEALDQCDDTLEELEQLKSDCDGKMASDISSLMDEVEEVKEDVIAVVTGQGGA